MSTLKANAWQSSNGVPYDKLIQHQSYSLPGLITTITNPNSNYTSTSLALTITSKKANSKFFIMADCQGYVTTQATNGWNIAIVRNIAGVDTYVAGYTGGSGDSWMGMYHSSGLATNSWSKCRTSVDTPNVAKGTAITYTVYIGGWTTTGGTFYFGYDGYGDFGNKITVFEFAG